MNYKNIAKILNLDVEKDIESAKILNRLICDLNKKFAPGILENLIKNKVVIVFGAGPSLLKDIEKIKARGMHEKCTLIAADGAVKALLEKNIIPGINVTDLDGDIEAIIEANNSGTVTLIHAHGDNILQLKKYVPEFRGVIFGTCQVNRKNLKNIYNFGGFTDGDRCVFLGRYFNAKIIAIAGMDFGKVIGSYSGCYDYNFKIKKMEIAKILLEEIASGCGIFNLTVGGDNLKNIEKIEVGEFEKLVEELQV
ncbi:hypothetical protein BEH94_06615 [Candidatus Altiarchaeales archaeon WOR_SM1_SCG]|nr:hypothetical protein BEH94_06615 [Candidatus Altiarchaeales archaeon WOR_SM1_SCG]